MPFSEEWIAWIRVIRIEVFWRSIISLTRPSGTLSPQGRGILNPELFSFVRRKSKDHLSPKGRGFFISKDHLSPKGRGREFAKRTSG